MEQDITKKLIERAVVDLDFIKGTEENKKLIEVLRKMLNDYESKHKKIYDEINNLIRNTGRSNLIIKSRIQEIIDESDE